MKILKLDIRHFGKLEELVLEPEAGLNCYCHPNEYGKTTLIYFIYYMFYGYTAKMLKKYLPWSGAEMAGSLTFEEGGRIWQIHRRHPAKGMEKRSVICVTTGEEKSFANQEQPGPYFLGVDGETFLRSFCITQGDLVFARTDGLDVALKNMAATGDENVSYQQAEDWLHKEHTKYMYRGKTQGPLLDKKERLAEDTIALREARLALERQIVAHREWEQLEKDIPESDRKVAALREQLGKAEAADAAKLLEQLRALEQRKPMDPPAVSKEQIEQWAMAYTAKEQAIEALSVAEQEKERLGEQAALVGESLGQFGFHALSARDMEKLQKKGGFPWWTLPLIGAVVTEATALLAELGILHAAAAAMLVTAIIMVVIKKSSRRRLCHAYGAADERQLLEKWEKYNQVIARQQELKEAVKTACEEADRRKAAADAANGRLEELRQKTRIFSAEELQEQRILWGVYENSLKQDRAELQIQALLGGRSRSELEALAKNAEPIDVTAAEVRERLDRAEEKNRDLRARREQLDPRALEALWTRMRELTRLTSATRKEIRQGEEQLFAVQKALGWLKQANEEMNTRFAPRLCSMAGEHLARLTDGKYDTLLLDSKFGISLVSTEGTFPIEAFSAGTRDAVYFAFRLAVGEILSETVLPMVLDDPFTNLDNPRREAAEKLLETAAETRQILYFTCRE